jgi:predicted DNA-binding protein with PD1-like motif
MKFSEANTGRIFIIRLEDGEVVHETIERFAGERGIRSAALIVLGGADTGSKLVVGPEEGRSEKISPMRFILENVHEMAGAGTLFPNEKGVPVLHMHAACGRNGSTVTGCVREGVKVWHVMEVILFELAGSSAVRSLDPKTGFELLQP